MPVRKKSVVRLEWAKERTRIKLESAVEPGDDDHGFWLNVIEEGTVFECGNIAEIMRMTSFEHRPWMNKLQNWLQVQIHAVIVHWRKGVLHWRLIRTLVKRRLLEVDCWMVRKTILTTRNLFQFVSVSGKSVAIQIGNKDLFFNDEPFFLNQTYPYSRSLFTLGQQD